MRDSWCWSFLGNPPAANRWPLQQMIVCYWRKAYFGGRYLMFTCPECNRPARVRYAWSSDSILFFSCRKCAVITYQSTMGHRWDRSARCVEKLRARLRWGASGTIPIKPLGMHERTYQQILGMLAYHEAVRNLGASYALKFRPDQHRAHLWRQWAWILNFRKRCFGLSSR
jgi:hypothetical protein